MTTNGIGRRSPGSDSGTTSAAAGALESNTRAFDSQIVTDFENRMSYADYLALPELLAAQHPVSVPQHHDELLFIIQHQTTELWLKLMLHELRSATEALKVDDLPTTLKRIARVKHIQETMTQQWSVLATLTPSEYGEFRQFLANSSGFQSYQYRAVEFLLGNKNAKMLTLFENDASAHALLTELLEAPSLYDEFLRFLDRAGFAVPSSALERDVTVAYSLNTELVPVFVEVYTNASEHWRVYEACEEFVDLEDNFQLWRFRHLKTVQRTIGMKSGTGGSTGAAFLQKALSLTFFPELFAVRTELGGS
jgi:tryptophan 2,3-dioxygenase